MEVDPAAEKSRKFTLHCGKPDEPYRVPRFNFHEHVNIAVRPKIIPQHRAIQRKFANMMLPTKRRKRGVMHVEILYFLLVFHLVALVPAIVQQAERK